MPRIKERNTIERNNKIIAARGDKDRLHALADEYGLSFNYVVIISRQKPQSVPAANISKLGLDYARYKLAKLTKKK